MFNNARHYNEEGSVVYQDADTLDRILRAKWRSMSQSRATSSKRYVVVWVFQQAVGCEVSSSRQCVFVADMFTSTIWAYFVHLKYSRKIFLDMY